MWLGALANAHRLSQPKLHANRASSKGDRETRLRIERITTVRHGDPVSRPGLIMGCRLSASQSRPACNSQPRRISPRVGAAHSVSHQSAAFHWLQAQTFVQRNRIATAGNSFGGIQAVLGAERLDYCATVNASGGAEAWAGAPPLRDLMTRAVRK